MASSTSLQDVLDQIVHARNEVSYQLHKDKVCSAKYNGVQAEIVFPESLESTRKKLANLAAQLLQLATDPKEYLEQISANHGSVSYSELAEQAGVPHNQLKSVVRMAAAHGFLKEVSLDNVSHSPHSLLIATDPSFHNWARWLVNYSVPSAYHFPDATQKWGKTEQKNETAFNLAMSVEVPFFGYLKENVKMNSMFSSYMRNVASTEAMSFKHMIAGFDWGSLAPGSLIVDVGGSGGHGSRALASAFPTLKFVVQDLVDTIKNAEVPTSGSAEGRGDRVQFMAHDFFTPQPIMDADVFLLRMIIHDWPDESAITILTHLRNALKKPGARVVVMDTILPQPGTISILQERQLRVRDLTMMQVFNAKEREFDTWTSLVKRAGLKILNTSQPEGSNMGLLELGLEEIPKSSTNGIHQTAINGYSSQSSGEQNPKTVNGVNDIHNSSDLTQNLHASPQSLDAATNETLPVIIVGAGISGLCLAQFLHKHSIPFLVFERDPTENYRPQGYRLKLEADAAAALRESLTPEAYRAFEVSCAKTDIGETDYQPTSGVCIKSRAGGGLYGSQGLRASYTVDRSVFRRTLMSSIGDKVHFGREFASYEVTENSSSNSVNVTFRDGSTVRGRFLVGADGTRSTIRKQLTPEHKFLDTGAVCIYGKTNISSDLLASFPAKGLRWMTVCTDTAPLIQSILIGESPLTLLSEPIRFSAESRAETTIPLPEDYVYWVLIGRKELFTEITSATAPSHKLGTNSEKAFDSESAKLSAAQSLALTEEWHPSLRSLFEHQDVQQASTMRVVSAPPKIAPWKSNTCVTMMGDAVHAMSPCGGVGANTALRDAAELGKLLSGIFPSTTNSVNGHSEITGPSSVIQKVADFEEGLRKRALAGIMRSYVGSKRMFDQKSFEDLAVVEDYMEEVLPA
ncbi:O-methyltransferase-domain-containing protein [Paraphoma chrysanthemicola]|uniref:O-methyltransferase-domain-containing protein n=1 Tax=Paraphoma chrysanthemicola TaxID=798071 RepID=A0A8K0RH41_9PLEO|nr:O-methyltransferase-domain-containing protein [Paraphoma chrysanthemicola]